LLINHFLVFCAADWTLGPLGALGTFCKASASGQSRVIWRLILYCIARPVEWSGEERRGEDEEAASMQLSAFHSTIELAADNIKSLLVKGAIPAE
jgi:hypothetical protein